MAGSSILELEKTAARRDSSRKREARGENGKKG
jgi:hypothetical protein